jgi:hypothetical protein
VGHLREPNAWTVIATMLQVYHRPESMAELVIEDVELYSDRGYLADDGVFSVTLASQITFCGEKPVLVGELVGLQTAEV